MSSPQIPVDLLAVAGEGGVVWSAPVDGFHANLVVLAAGGSIAAHRNDSVDVLVVLLAGDAVLSIDDLPAVPLRVGTAVVVPRGSVRALTAGGGVRYLTVHAPRTLSIDTARHRAEEL